MSGRVVHFEIPFDDGDRAAAFYRETFGWNVQHIPDLAYTLVSTGPTSEESGPTEPGYIGGGMMQRADFVQGPIVTVDVDDIDSALAKVEERGGKTVRARQEVGQMGYSAYFQDPEGNLMGLWQNAPGNG